MGSSFDIYNWSGIKDSNLRPRGPKPRALANCANPRWIANRGDYTGNSLELLVFVQQLDMFDRGSQTFVVDFDIQSVELHTATGL